MRRRIKDKRQIDILEEQKRLWLVNARERAVEIAAREGTVSTDDIRTAFPIPGGINRNVMGKLFKISQFVFQ